MENQKALLQQLPKVDECIALLSLEIGDRFPALIVKQAVQSCIETQRRAILQGDPGVDGKTTEQWTSLFVAEIQRRMAYRLRRVINCTGVVVHTNLGRSLLPELAVERLAMAAGYYSNLEFDLATGKRGSRYSLVEDLICELTGAEAALVVNNNAAAVMLVLDTLAKDREVIVSRGQLVEIGGSFRIPDVMAKSGARLVEVGATNRTHLRDYQQAIGEETAMLLRVHTSNFRVIGFTSEVPAEEIAMLAKRRGLVSMEDLGSGSLLDLSRFGLVKEPTVQEVVKAGIDVVTFSGDKLLGGPQAGIIVGSASYIDSIKKNPLNRALRIDKFTLASLEAILRCYYDPEQAAQQIPTLAMLTADSTLLRRRARKIEKRVRGPIKEECEVTVVPTTSRVGGGAMPECSMQSWAVQLEPRTMRLNVLERVLREQEPAIVGRIENDHFLLDVRTVQDREVIELCEILTGVFTNPSTTP